MGGINSNVLPFGLDQKRSSTYSELGRLLGEEFDVSYVIGNDTFRGRARLVQLNLSAGFASPGRRVFKYSSTDPNDYDVEPVDGTSDRPCGVSLTGLNDLVDNDYFLVIFDGRVQVFRGDDATAVAAGNYIDPDNDTDLGKVKSSTTTQTQGVTIGRALEAAASTDTAFIVEILDPLKG